MQISEIRLFAPATIANVSCGFDVLGCCLDEIGDEMIIRKSTKKGVHIDRIIGEKLPMDPKKNVAGVAIMALLDALDQELDFGFELTHVLLGRSNEHNGFAVSSLKTPDVEAEECKAVIDMSDSGFALAELQFEFAFKKQPGLFFQLHRAIFAAIPEQEPIVRISD